MNKHVKKFVNSYIQLPTRSKILVTAAFGGLALTLIYYPVGWIGEYTERVHSQKIVRKREAIELLASLKRYSELERRLAGVQATYNRAQMTFEQVTQQVDKIVKDSIGSDAYDLKPGRTPTKLGDEFERQEFTIRVRKLGLDQLVKLLYELEQGETQLNLSKVDIRSIGRSGDFSATLEIFSVRKQSA